MKNKLFILIQNYIETKRSSFLFLFLFTILIILCIIRQFMLGYYCNIFLCVFSLFLLLLPMLLQYKFKIVLSNALEIFIYIFLFSAVILGEVYHFYSTIPYWDLFLHTLGGFLCAGIGLSFIDLVKSKQVQYRLFPILASLFSFCFSMTIGVLWEFSEYTMDNIFLFDTQKDAILNNISSIILDESKNSQPVKIKDIYKTILYDHDYQELTTIYDGYLDIGLNDTMQDLLANFFGASIYSLFGYFYIKNGGKKNLAGKFLFVKN